MNLRQAAEMALHAFMAPRDEKYGRLMQDAIKALSSALAEADEPVAWRTEAARWLRRQADDAERDSDRTGWANPARHMPDTLRRIANDLDAEQEAAPYGMDCSPEPRREQLTEEQIEVVRGKLASQAFVYLPTTKCKCVVRIIERAHGIGDEA